MFKLSHRITKVDPPSGRELRTIRILICCAVVSLLIFIYWFADPAHIGYAPVFWMLTIALGFKLIKMAHECYHYWSPSVPARPVSDRQWRVDVLTTACPGEPREMIIRTLKAMKAITYPHTNYLCDEGDDPVLKEFCNEHGIVHVTRTVKVDAKAGNINNALKQATGEICVVLDPDHEPVPEFLDRVLPYFEDEGIGFVQSVQAYGNQGESFIARGAAEQTYHFYGPMMMCMNTYGTVQAIGANCVFRREALDSIGGHAAGLSEDMHTAMQLHAKGWRSVYIPEILTRGLVPATLSSYYKQQLKWSRGTFELLFRTFPKLYKNFTWRQKLHYFTIPLYFLHGLVNLIDIAVPLLALYMAETPWSVDLEKFGMYFISLCGISLIIRMYAQRWLLEKHERGFHFAGGIVRTATWWIFLVGFVYTIFKIKVPYIPTPKEDEHQNYFRLSLPNIITVLVAAVVVTYGLHIDWTPYSFAMAVYSVLSIAMLSFTVLMSQQKFLKDVQRLGTRFPGLRAVAGFAESLATRGQQAVYGILRNGPVMILLALSLVFLSYSSPEGDADTNPALTAKNLGGFYLGVELPEQLKSSELFNGRNTAFNVVALRQEWKKSDGPFDVAAIDQIGKNGAMPYITWESGAGKDECGSLNREVRAGLHDDYLKKCAAFFRDYRKPIFLSFASSDNDPENVVLTWQYIYTFFNNLGISNITWVWCPTQADERFYPGEKFTDWIGIDCRNYGQKPESKDWYTFSQIYTPYRNTFGKFKKPVMITRFGCLAGSSQAEWYRQAMEDISKDFQEINSVVIFKGREYFKTVSAKDTVVYTADFSQLPATGTALEKALEDERYNAQLFGDVKGFSAPQTAYRSSFVKGAPGKFELTLNGRPYYIKGVAYNTAHDWRDGNMPLTRKQLEKDFIRIKAMGANTIRRYGTGIYDRNVLNISQEYGLNVLYGFWFDPKIDFYRDSVKIRKYISEVEEAVLEYRDRPSVIAWSLGNESWGLLKHRYAKPYLTVVRDAYIRFIEHLAQRIHQLDPSRPVFTCIEHEEYQLAGELVAFRDGAPSIDVMGVNSYYKEQIEKLNHITWQFDSLRPYMISEFGPKGYWDPKYNRLSKGSLIEESDEEKAEWYKEQWVRYVRDYKGYNVGGFAYCWHDRMEGTYTWFGLTDYKGRLKPSYYALKQQWTMENGPGRLPQFRIQAPPAISPGKELRFTALGDTKPDYKYEWRLLKDEYLDQVDALEADDDPRSIQLTVPAEPSDYRLYLFVSDQTNAWVTTASVPVKVE